MIRLQFVGETPGGIEAFIGLGLGDDDRETLVDRVAELLWQVSGDIPPLVDVMRTSS